MVLITSNEQRERLADKLPEGHFLIDGQELKNSDVEPVADSHRWEQLELFGWTGDCHE